jgi:hypothetical protein
MKCRMPRLFLIMLSAALVVACGQREGQDAAPPVASSMTVTSVTPERDSVLRVGDEVAVRVEVAYTLGSAAGNVGLVVQSGDGEVLAEQVGAAVRGEHAMTLQAGFRVPQTDVVHLVVPLSERGRSTTSDVEIISYEVDPR